MPRGGKRPGAGRKPKAVEEYRLRMQARFEAVSQEDVDAMIRAVVGRVKVDGDPKAFSVVAPYIFGPAPKELTVKGDAERPVEVRHGVSGPEQVAEVLRILAGVGALDAATPSDADTASD